MIKGDIYLCSWVNLLLDLSGCGYHCCHLIEVRQSWDRNFRDLIDDSVTYLKGKTWHEMRGQRRGPTFDIRKRKQVQGQKQRQRERLKPEVLKANTTLLVHHTFWSIFCHHCTATKQVAVELLVRYNNLFSFRLGEHVGALCSSHQAVISMQLSMSNSLNCTIEQIQMKL